MADSFYGGKPGRDFLIKDAFGSIEDMVKAFQTGPEYTKAWFDEIVIIDTHNKNNPDNGKLFRRGFDYTNEMGGALYLGQIVGPRAGTPYMHLVTLEEAKEHSVEELQEWEYRQFPTGMDENGKYKYSTDPGEEGKPIGIFDFSKDHDASLVPGKKDDGSFNDKIRWTWVNIRKDDDEAGTVVYLGWEIPYLVQEYKTHTVDQYDERGDVLENPSTATREDDKSHPYYELWNLGIPKGIKGDALRNLRVITPTEEDKTKLYDIKNITIDPETGEVSVGSPGYDGLDDDVENSREILVFDLFAYDKKINPDPISIYLADWNMVNEITLSEDGTLTVGYTHDDDTVFEKKIQWIDNVNLSPDTGEFDVEYNNGAEKFHTVLDWIKNIVVDADGTIHFWHTKDNRDDTHENVIKWIDDVKLSQDDGKFIVNYNYGDNYESQLDWIKDIVISEENGDITLHHTNPAEGEELLPAKLKLIVKANIDKYGKIKFVFNTGETLDTMIEGTDSPFAIRIIENIVLAKGLEGDHRLGVKYNTDDDIVYLGDPINFIEDLVIRESDHHLLVLYNDPTHRANAEDLTEGVDAQGHKWINKVTRTNGTVTPDNIYWRDFGTVKDQSGVLVGMNVTDSELEGKDILEWLDDKYPNGITEGNMKDKIVTHTSVEGGSKDFYAYDYNKNEWYYLGTFEDSQRDVKIVESLDPSMAELQGLAIGGVAFKATEIVTGQANPIPSYWSPEYNDWE